MGSYGRSEGWFRQRKRQRLSRLPCVAQGWGRGDGRGTPDGCFVAGTADARSKIGNASDAHSVMRYPTRASELDHRRLSASPPPLRIEFTGHCKSRLFYCDCALENGHQSIRQTPRMHRLPKADTTFEIGRRSYRLQSDDGPLTRERERG